MVFCFICMLASASLIETNIEESLIVDRVFISVKFSIEPSVGEIIEAEISKIERPKKPIRKA